MRINAHTMRVIIDPANPVSALVFLAGLALLFGMDAVIWMRFGLTSSLYSYILLIPLISLYFLWEQRGTTDPTPEWGNAILMTAGLICGLLVLAGLGRWDPGGELDRLRLGLMVAALAGGAVCWWGPAGWRSRLFPILFLAVMIPPSAGVEDGLNEFLQRASGWLAYHLIAATGIPILRDGPYLLLPNLYLEVAEECSGIRSTLVLLVSATIAAHLFLRRLSTRVVFVALVIPLGILRNAFRIQVIVWLTVHVDPGIIHGPLHHHGGPLFFGLSLVVLVAALFVLRKSETGRTTRKKDKKMKTTPRNQVLHGPSSGVILVMLLVATLLSGCNPRSAHERHWERGNQFFERERYAEAIVSYLNVLQREPDHAEAIRQLGLAYYHNAEFVRAFPLIRDASLLEPDRIDLKLILARLYLTGGASEDALWLAEEILEREPGHLEALLILANASRTPDEVRDGLVLIDELAALHEHEPEYYLALGALNMRKGDLKEAEDALTEAIRIQPDSAEAYAARGELFALMDDEESAGTDLEKAYELSESGSPARLRWATFNRSLGRVDEARRLLDEMLAESPEFFPALYELAAIDASEQRMDASLVRLNEILGIQPNHLPSLLLRARLWYLQGRFDVAEKSLEEMVRNFPRAPAVRVDIARLYLRTGRQARAEHELREALRLAPMHEEASLALAEIDIRAGRYAAAVSRLTPFTETDSTIRNSALILVGTALRLAEDWDRALIVYAELADVLPESPEPVFLMGLTHQAAGRQEEAAAAFRKAIELDPGYVPGLARLADMEVQAGRYDQAMTQVARQIEQTPDSAGLYYVRASIATQREDWVEVEASLRKAIEFSPTLSPAYRDLGRLFVRQGRIEEAMDMFNGALAINGRDTSSMMMIGVLYEQEGQIPQAEQTYERIIEIDPDFAAALNNLAYLLATQEKALDRALDLAQRARTLAPKDAGVADTLGLVALKKGDYRWALSLFEESVLQLDGEPNVWYHVGLARHGLGREESAREALAKALNIERDFPGRDRARLLLNVLEIPLVEITEEGADRLEVARRIMPDNPSVLVRLAALRQQDGFPDEARALNNQALSVAEDFLPALINLTWLEDQPERAIVHGRRARELAPDQPEVAHALGWAAYRAGDYTWARSLLAEAATRRTTDAHVLFHLGKASLMMSRLDHTRQAAERALSAATRDEQRTAMGAFLQLLTLYEERKAGDESAEILAAARLRDPSDPLVQLASARLAIGDEAVRAYHQLMTSFPSWSLPVRDLAALRVNAGGSDEETLQLAQTARTRLPDDPEALRSYGLVLAYRGSAQQAVPLLQRVVDRHPEDGPALYWLATSMAAIGATDEAAPIMKRAIEVGLPDPLKQVATHFLETAME